MSRRLKQLLLAFLVFFIFHPNSHAQPLTSEQTTALLSAKQGSIVELKNFFTKTFPLIPYQRLLLPGSQYIISDDPEYIRIPETFSRR